MGIALTWTLARQGRAQLGPEPPSHDAAHRVWVKGSNLSSAQALAAVNACLALDPQAEGNTIGARPWVILGKFLPNTERERILDEAGDDSGRCDAAAVGAAILKSAEVLCCRSAGRQNLDHFSLNDLRSWGVRGGDLLEPDKAGEDLDRDGPEGCRAGSNRWESGLAMRFRKYFDLC